MKKAKTSRALPANDSWSLLSNGHFLSQQIQERLDDYLPKRFGYHLLKLGPLSCELALNSSMIPHHISCSDEGDGLTVKADLNELPFQGSSIDLCILAHQLNYSNDPHQLLREIQRVLTLDGTLILTGYNPISMFGLYSLLQRDATKRPNLFHPARVVDWLQLLGFEIEKREAFDFLFHKKKQVISYSIENLGESYCPFFCSSYFILARKRSTPMTPVKNKFKFKAAEEGSGAVIATYKG